MVAKPAPPKSLAARLFTLSMLGDVIWGVLYFMTLGFAPKYRERLHTFECLDPGNNLKGYTRYSVQESFSGYPYIPIPWNQDDDSNQKYECSDTHARMPTASSALTKITDSQLFHQPRFQRDTTGESLRTKQVVSLIYR